MKQYLQKVNVPINAYNSYNFCKGVAQHAKNYRLLDEYIQALGYWILNIFHCYFDISHIEFFYFNKNF